MAAAPDILIDVTRLIGRTISRQMPTGIDRVCQQYTAHYKNIACAVIYNGRKRYIFSQKSSRFIFSALEEWRPLSRISLARLFFLDRLAGFYPRTRGALFLNVTHSGIEHDWYADDLIKMGVQPVFMIHDLIPLRYPDNAREGEAQRHANRLRNMLRTAAGLISNSNETLRDVESYAKEQGILMPPAIVSLLGTQILPDVATHHEENPSFVMVGTIEGRKNHAMILRLWKKLAMVMGDNTPRLIILGARGWRCDEACALLDHDPIINTYVKEIGAADDETLAEWLKRARALVFPSSAEGFGMPITEALSLGTPVIASDLPVFKEAAGDVPDYVSLKDEEAWLNVIRNYADNQSTMCDEQHSRLKNYVAPTWEDHFQKINDFMDGIAAQTIHVFGLSWRKRRILRAYLPRTRIIRATTLKNVPAEAALLVWGSQDVGGHIHTIRAEDGFVRSSGLGVSLIKPLSLVFDRKGIYYDASSPSGLEKILAAHSFSPALLERSRALRQKIIRAGITKYNVTGRVWHRPAGVKKIILVPGQVESDASVRYGSPVYKCNIDFLKAVRERYPDAYILYKPHPDVVAGLRLAGNNESQTLAYADEIISDVAIETLLPQVDCVHVLTSLTGFEALLRGVPVTCYGHPFYAGWGLTEDIFPIPRRKRQLSLDELVAASLILYPSYEQGKTPEQIVDKLINLRGQKANVPQQIVSSLFNYVLRKVAY